jgi:hypothetical protein
LYFCTSKASKLSPSHPHSPFTLANCSFVNLVFIFRCSSSTTNPVCERHVNVLVCSIPLLHYKACLRSDSGLTGTGSSR